VSAADLPPRRAEANGHAHSRFDEANSSKPMPTEPEMNWFTFAPPGPSDSKHVCWSLEEDFTRSKTDLCFGHHCAFTITITRTVRELKSLHSRLRDMANEYRDAHRLYPPEPRHSLSLHTHGAAAPLDKRESRKSQVRCLNVRLYYGFGAIEFEGVAANGDWFDAWLTVEDAEALAYDLARTIARLEGRTPLWP
jgi:hypothetical protein